MADVNPLAWGAAVAFVAALLGTPLAWRLTRGMARWPRILAASVLPTGATALLSLAGPGGAVTAALTYSAIMQAFLLPFLALLPRKA